MVSYINVCLQLFRRCHTLLDVFVSNIRDNASRIRTLQIVQLIYYADIEYTFTIGTDKPSKPA